MTRPPRPCTAEEMAATPSDAHAAVLLLRSELPGTLEATIPKIVFQHQVYTIVSNRTLVHNARHYFWTISHGFPAPYLPHTPFDVLYLLPVLTSDAGWCLQSDAMPDPPRQADRQLEQLRREKIIRVFKLGSQADEMAIMLRQGEARFLFVRAPTRLRVRASSSGLDLC